MATRTAYPPTSLRYRLRNFKVLRQGVRFARRVRHLPAVVPAYARKLGLEGVWVFLVIAMSRHGTLVAVPGISEPVKIRPKTSDKYCFEQIFLEDCYNVTVSGRPRLIIDGGANVGYASIFFANRYPGASILAVEPDATNYSTLISNIHPYPQIKAVQGAIWHKAETVVVDNSDDSWAVFVTDADSVAERDHARITVPGFTVDDLLKMSGEDVIDILKLDVEGAEKTIFSAPDCSWLGKTRLLIIELHDRMVPGCSQALDQAVRPYSFRRELRGENLILVSEKEPHSVLG